jgi:hypothetical protein
MNPLQLILAITAVAAVIGIAIVLIVNFKQVRREL